jgi:hypothetical protein
VVQNRRAGVEGVNVRQRTMAEESVTAMT